MSDDLELKLAGFDRPLTRAELRAWLDRKPPPGSWRDFETTAPALDLKLKEKLCA